MLISSFLIRIESALLWTWRCLNKVIKPEKLNYPIS
jgi:hypothetical protein